MTSTQITRVICLAIIGAPPIISAATDVAVPPWALLLLALCSMVAALVMGELDPLWRPRNTMVAGTAGVPLAIDRELPPLSDADIDRLARRGLELMREQEGGS